MTTTVEAPPGVAALSTRGLSFTIGGARIVEEIELSVRAGELVGVIGPNGAGKTTLFNLLTGIVRPSAGTVHVGGRDVTGLSPARRARLGLGRSFQSSSLFPELPAVENVRLALQIHRPGAMSVLRPAGRHGALTERARALLAEVGLSARAEAPAGSLAHGEQRKVEIAMLLATEPSVLLLDEPLAGVGSGDIDELAELIGRLSRAQGRTVLLVEHHLDVVLGLADRIAVLHHGRLLRIGTREQIMADETVQDAYLGSVRR